MFKADPAANCFKHGKMGRGAMGNGPVIFFLSGHPKATNIKYSLRTEGGGFIARTWGQRWLALWSMAFTSNNPFVEPGWGISVGADFYKTLWGLTTDLLFVNQSIKQRNLS